MEFVQALIVTGITQIMEIINMEFFLVLVIVGLLFYMNREKVVKFFSVAEKKTSKAKRAAKKPATVKRHRTTTKK